MIPNNNTITIGATTTDSTGTFGYSFVHSTSGIYKITATFAGSGSYWSSTSQTRREVIAASAGASAAPTATPTFVADMYFVPAIAGLFVLIVILAIVLAMLMLRKRP